MSKYLGINFQRDEFSGIASVTVTNDTKGTNLIFDDRVDLYINPAIALTTEDFTYWVKLPYPDDSYSITVNNMSYHNDAVDYYHNPSASTPYYILLQQMFITESLNNAIFQKKIYLWNDNYPSDIYQFTLENEVVKELYKTQSFTADGVSTSFTLSSGNRASEIIEISNNGGVTWLDPTDISLSYGNNSPDYDNEIYPEDGYITVNFDYAPLNGDIVMIKYRPMTNKAYIETTIKQPTDGVLYYDKTYPIRELDYNLTLIGGD